MLFNFYRLYDHKTGQYFDTLYCATLPETFKYHGIKLQVVSKTAHHNHVYKAIVKDAKPNKHCQ